MFDGKRVKIRTVLETDLAALFSSSQDYTDPGEYMPINPVSQVAFRKEFNTTGFWQDHCGKLIIEDKHGNLIGEAGFFKASHYMDGREIYYRIFSGHRGKGYASDALSVLVKLFFDATTMSRIQAITIQGNSTSEHILTKAGFQFEGTMRQARYFRGELVDLNVYSLLRTDFCS